MPKCHRCRSRVRWGQRKCFVCGADFIEGTRRYPLIYAVPPPWSWLRAVLFLAALVACALVLSRQVSADVVNYASGLIYSSIPQALAGLFGLLAAVLALSSESVAASYGVSPARILAGDPQTKLLAVGYVATIVVSLVGLLTYRSLVNQTLDEWCLIVATA